MESIRKWFYRPKRDDTSLLAQFFYANEALTAVACELDSFDGRQEPERCTTLVNQLRHCQDKVLTICNQIMDELIPESRANRDFRVKFPDDVMQENLAGQLWFGAECLAAGSSIVNREVESAAMRPLAKALTKSLEIVRNLLREHALKGHMNLKAQNPLEPTLEKLIESLKIFDRLFADFELCYVAAMVPVKSTKEYEQQELVCVLFSETLQKALERSLLSQADVDNYEPALMFTIPRLAIVSGLLAAPGGPLCLNSADTISEMFRPFRNLLLKIRELLWTLNNRELYMLEKLLCSNEEPSAPISQSTKTACHQDLEEFVHNFYTDYPNCKDFIVDFYTVTRNTGTNMDEVANDAVEILDQESSRIEYLIEKRLQPERDKQQRREKKRRETRQEHSSNCMHGRSMNSRDEIRISGQNGDQQQGGVSPIMEESSRECEIAASGLVRTPENINEKYPSSSGDQNESPRRTDFLSSDISHILGSSGHIEIPQTQYLLNQVSHENNVTGETIHVENSLPDIDSIKLISEANKTLSSLLLEGECQNEISEQTDSGICTVISSENTSLYDKSPEEKKTFANEIHEDEEQQDSVDVENLHDTYNEFSRPSTPKDDISSVSGMISGKNNSLDNQMDNSSSQNNSSNTETSKNVTTRISSNFNGTNEEFVGLAYGNGQISVCDSNPSTFQINYSENWENLNLNIDSSESTKEFWRDLKYKNCPSTSHDINKIGSNIERYAQERISARRSKDSKGKKRHQRRFERRLGKRGYDDTQRSLSCNVRSGHRLSPSTESSRSNSTDRCLNPRLASFGASLHPSQNTRQMPNFGSHSPQRSPRLCHFEPRLENPRNQNFGHRNQSNSSPQNRKLLEHRRSRSEQIAKMRRRDIDKKDQFEHGRNDGDSNSRSFVVVDGQAEMPNDGLGPRTDKSGLASESSSPESMQKISRYENSRDEEAPRRTLKPKHLVNPAVIARATTTSLELPLNRRDVVSSSSCSSCCDSSSETSEFQSDCQDDEEIALAMQAAEIANRNQIRAKFRSSEDLVHRLFVCIAGVADQLQTNFASDLRNILKCVFLMNSTQVDSNEEQVSLTQPAQPEEIENSEGSDTNNHLERQDSLQENEDDLEETSSPNERTSPVTERGEECVERAPAWVPDNDAPRCMACQAGFTVVRRRHHCRNCGKVFCGRCSSNNVPLPRYGHTKPVRVCNRCFLYQVTPFTVSQATPTS